MRFRGILLTVVVLLAAIVAALNWGALVAPVPIHLLVITLQGPLAFILLLASVVLALLFFLAALLDRAGQLQQVTRLDRQLAAVRSKLEAREQEDVGRVEARLDRAMEGLTRQVEGLERALGERASAVSEAASERLQARLGELETALKQSLEQAEARDKERSDAVLARVATVRDELAADIAQAEDALARLADSSEGEGEQA